MREKTLLGRANYYVLCALVVIATLWGGVQLNGWARPSGDQLKREREYIPPGIAFDKVMAIYRAAKADTEYTPDHFVRDQVAIDGIVMRSSATSYDATKGIHNDLRDHLFAVSATRYARELSDVEKPYREGLLAKIVGTQLQMAREKYPPEFGRVDLVKSLWQLVFLLVFFSFGACGILILRVLHHSPSLGQALAIYRHDWREIAGSSFFWMLGLSDSGYNPELAWLWRVRERATVAELESPERFLEELRSLRFRVMPRREAFGLFLQVIWSSIPWQKVLEHRWSLAAWRMIAREFRSAVYLSIIAGIHVGLGYSVAYAAEEKMPEKPWLKGINVVSTFSPGGQALPTEHLFFFGRDGTTVTLLGVTGPTPQYEFSRVVGKASWKNLYLEGGPFVILNEKGSTDAYGVTGFFSFKKGRFTLAGPLYGARDREGTTHLWMPGTVGIYSLTKRFSAGFGVALFANTKMDEPSLATGPVIQYRFSPGAALRARFTNGGTGFFRGTGERVRLDAIFSF